MIRKIYRAAKEFLIIPAKMDAYFDELLMNQGVLLSSAIYDRKDYRTLADLEFKVFSQFGDDGIIQYLTHNIDCKYKTFIEFGVEDYFESNTRFLLQKDNWSGFVMDGSSDNIANLKQAPFYWKHDLEAEAVFITAENINNLLSSCSVAGGVDLLHIDLDGNDYWVWKEIEIQPSIVILEYNSVFGLDRPITVPYRANFNRTNAHFSNLYYGASLKAMYDLTVKKGYSFIGCNSAGNNAYFIRKDKMNGFVREVALEEGYVLSKSSSK